MAVGYHTATQLTGTGSSLHALVRHGGEGSEQRQTPAPASQLTLALPKGFAHTQPRFLWTFQVRGDISERQGGLQTCP